VNVVIVGAHAMDAELMAGAIAASERDNGGNVLIAHLTRGERGHPSKGPDEFGGQLDGEMRRASEVLEVEATWLGALAPLEGPAVVPILATLLAERQPELVITHWSGSWHPSHREAHVVTGGAIEHAGIKTTLSYAENCEDLRGFSPTHYLDVSAVYARWMKAVGSYELFRRSVPGSGLDSAIPYWAYYTAALRVHGLQAGIQYAQALMLPEGSGDLGRVRRL
jgi:LmbE family N-acetylglucosaminyl deacetylase